VQIPCLFPQEAHVSGEALGKVAVPSSPKNQYGSNDSCEHKGHGNEVLQINFFKNVFISY
jgi:hypothetical protein